MKKKMRSVLTLTIVMLFANVNLAQEGQSVEKEKPKHTLGVGYEFDGWYPATFNLAYRRYLKNINLKGAIHYGIPYNNDDKFSTQFGNPTRLSNVDSTGNFIGKEAGWMLLRRRRSFVKIGIEKKFRVGLLNFFGGIDAMVGNLTETWGSSVYEYSENIFNPDFPIINNEANNVKTKVNNLIYGATLNLGLNIDVTKKLYFTAMLSYNYYINHVLSQKTILENDLYKTELLYWVWKQNDYSDSFFSGNFSINYAF